MTIGSDSMQVTMDLSKKWFLMNGNENLIRTGGVKTEKEKRKKKKTKNSSSELCVKGAEKWSSSQK